MKVSFLETLAVVSLRVTQPKKSFLQDLVLLIPECKGNMLVTMTIAHTSNAILTPSERSRPSLVVRKMAPSITIVGVVFSDGSPLTLSSVTSPPLPVLRPLTVLFETFFLFAKVLVVINNDHGGLGRFKAEQIRDG